MRPSIGLANLLKILVACFDYGICLKVLSIQKIFTDFDYMYIHASNLKRDLPCNYLYLCNYFIICFVLFKKPLNKLIKIFKTWFSSVRLVYSHLLLHNIISNRTCVNTHFFRTENNLPNFCVIISENKQKETFRF